VREMWVEGNLKDQLGIRHRNAKKNKNVDESELESAPMFRPEPTQSLSELSSQPYESAPIASPGTGSVPRQTFLDTPPLSAVGNVMLREQGANQLYAKNNQDQEARLSPSAAHNDLKPPSPNPSYYSVSELPMPSPLPSPKYRYSSGEITSTPPSRRTSVSRSRSSIRPSPGPMPSSPPPPTPRSPNTLKLPLGPGKSLVGPLSGGTGEGTSADPGGYEMRLRTFSREFGFGHDHQEVRVASDASYATAYDDFWSAEDEPGIPYDQTVQHPSGHSQEGMHQHQEPVVVDDDDDRASVLLGEDHRPASPHLWEGGMAL